MREQLWPGKWADYPWGGQMLQVDLQAAGIEYQDADGQFADFYALRHTYISNLVTVCQWSPLKNWLSNRRPS